MEAGSKQSIPDATRVHKLLRFERVSCLQAFGVQIEKIQASDAMVRRERSLRSMLGNRTWIMTMSNMLCRHNLHLRKRPGLVCKP